MLYNIEIQSCVASTHALEFYVKTLSTETLDILYPVSVSLLYFFFCPLPMWRKLKLQAGPFLLHSLTAQQMKVITGNTIFSLEVNPVDVFSLHAFSFSFPKQLKSIIYYSTLDNIIYCIQYTLYRKRAE